MKNSKLCITVVSSVCFLLSGAAAQTHEGSTTTMKNYTVISGNTSLTVQPDAGARIVSFKTGRYEFLTGKEIHADNYGSTFWPSPQTLWNWPPPRVLDSDPYTLENGNGLLRMVSGKDPQTGLQFTKEFTSAQNGKIRITYSMSNAGNAAQKTAPWDISRLHKGGLLFFPLGEGSVGVKHFAPVPADVLDGIVWFQDGKVRPKESELSIANVSEGWAAFAIDGKIFIKKFPGVKPAQQAPGEAVLSIYVSSDADYIEFEIQGPYTALSPGKTFPWNIEWIAVDIPDTIRTVKGNKELVEFVRGIIR